MVENKAELENQLVGGGLFASRVSLSPTFGNFGTNSFRCVVFFVIKGS